MFKIGSIIITKMALNHLEDVHAIEQESFSVPWSKKELQSELTNNRLAVYLVALNENSDVMGYAGMWHVVNEGHITNIAVKREFRGQGVGSRLLESIIEIAGQKEMIGITLEVRISNMKAQSLYTKYGFKPEGFRKRYYSDTNEDAIIMWKHF